MGQIVVTGMGIICSAGNSKKEFFQFMESGETRKNLKKPRIQLDIDLLVAEADEKGLAELTGNPFDNPTSQLCVAAAKDCMNDYRASGGKQEPDALILGTSTGGQYLCEEYIFSQAGKGSYKGLNYPAQGMMSAATRAVATELKINGRVTTVSTACTSSANAIALGAMLIESGASQCVLAGGGDALCSTTLSGFFTLKLTGNEPAKPFGPNRPGLTLGEGAAFLILESKEKVLKEGRTYYAELCGYAMGSDAHHMTAPSENGEGAVDVMKRAMVKARVNHEDIDFINAHGTGTSLNDKTEAVAISQIFGKSKPVASIKGLTGHTLGGAGAIEAVASVYSILYQKGFENFNSYEAGDDCPIQLSPKGGITLRKNPYVLSNSFAFGGNNCSLLFGGKL